MKPGKMFLRITALLLSAVMLVSIVDVRSYAAEITDESGWDAIGEDAEDSLDTRKEVPESFEEEPEEVPESFEEEPEEVPESFEEESEEDFRGTAFGGYEYPDEGTGDTGELAEVDPDGVLDHGDPANWLDGIVLDAEKLPDNNIAILYIKPGETHSEGDLCYAVYDPVTGGYQKESLGVTSKDDATFALQGSTAHVAYTTTDGRIGYLHQTENGWSGVSFLESQMAKEKYQTGRVYAPDIIINPNGLVCFSYHDSNGDTKNYIETDNEAIDGEEAAIRLAFVYDYSTEIFAPHEFTCLPYAWFNHPHFSRITPCNRYDSYGCWLMFCSSNVVPFVHDGVHKKYFSLGAPDTGTTLSLASYQSDAYTLGASGGESRVSKVTLDGDDISISVLYDLQMDCGDFGGWSAAGDISIDDNGKIYYAIAYETDPEKKIHFYQDGEKITKTMAAPIHNVRRLESVLIGGTQYAVYSNEDGKIVIANINSENELVENHLLKRPQVFSGISANAISDGSAIVEGFEVGARYKVVSGARALNKPPVFQVSEENKTVRLVDISIPEGENSTTVVINKVAPEGTDDIADTPVRLTFTQWPRPELTPAAPTEINGYGSIPTESIHEYLYGNVTPDMYTEWHSCEGPIDISPETTYLVRRKASGMNLASPWQTIVIDPFEPAKETLPDDLGLTALGYYKVKVTNVAEAGEYIITGTALEGMGGSDLSYFQKGDNTINAPGLKWGTFSIKKRGNGKTTIESDPKEFTLTRAEGPELQATNPASIGGNGKIATTSDHEYTTYNTMFKSGQIDDAPWIACTGELSVPAGTYYVRRKASGTVLASHYQTITLTDPKKQPTPKATFTATGPDQGVFSVIAIEEGYEYAWSMNGTDYTDLTSDLKITGLSAGTLYLIRKGDGGVTEVDSDPQKFTVGKAETPQLSYQNPNNRGMSGKILTGADIYEYTTDPDTKWIDCYGDIEALNPGTYYVRVMATGTTLASDYQTITLTEDKAWVLLYTSKIEGFTDTTEYVVDGEYAKGPAKLPERTGYTVRWCTDEDGMKPFDLAKTRITEDMTLYGFWKGNPYTVKFDANGGSGRMDDRDRVYDDGKPLTANAFKAPAGSGKLFDCWNTKADGTGTSYAGEAVANLTAEAGTEVILYAQWVDDDWGELSEADIAAMIAAEKQSVDIPKMPWIGVILPVSYTGKSISLTADQLHVYDGKKLLVRNKDYTVKFSKNTDAGEAAVTVTGKGDYNDKLTGTFTISRKPFDGGHGISVSFADKAYNGKTQKVKPVVKDGKKKLTEGKDYELAYDPDPVAGTRGEVKVTITGKKNYEGVIESSYFIYDPVKTLKEAVVTIDQDYDLTYSEDEPRTPPVLSVKLNRNAYEPLRPYDGETGEGDYIVRYVNNESAGKAAVEIIGMNGIYGKKQVSFTIKTKEVKEENARIEITGGTVYTGKALKPAIVVKDGDTVIPASDYTMTWKNTTAAAKEDAKNAPTVTVNFRKNYSGTLTKKFTISPHSLSEDDLSISASDVKIRKESRKVTADSLKTTVKYGKTLLKRGRDYKVEFDRVDGTLQIARINLCGNYENEGGAAFNAGFRIYRDKDNIGSDLFEIRLDQTVYTYDGKAKKPAVEVYAKPGTWGTDAILLEEGRDYSVKYTNNTNSPTKVNKQPTVTVYGKGTLKGSRSFSFTINRLKLNTVDPDNVTVSVADVKCNGKTQKPKVTVTVNGRTLKKSDFSVTYQDTKNVTEAADVTVSGRGNYEGTIHGTFRVYRSDISKMTFTSIKDQVYNGTQITPGANDSADDPDGQNEIRIYTDKTKKQMLVPGTDYDLAWGVNTKTGFGTVIVIGKGTYGGRKILKFRIRQKGMRITE